MRSAWFYYQNAAEQQENYMMMKLSLSRLLARCGVCACVIDFNSTLIITGEGWKSALSLSVCVSWARERELRDWLLCLQAVHSLVSQQKLMHKNKMREKQKRVGVSPSVEFHCWLDFQKPSCALGARNRFKAHLSQIFWKENPRKS